MVHVGLFRKRTNVLLEDVLARLAPSLTDYTGCDVVDICPGVGLWSTLLHLVVKPRRHILLEPTGSPFKPFLEPHFDQPNSKYQYVETSGLSEPWSPSFYAARGLLPQQIGLASLAGKHRDPNKTLLILANISRISSRVVNHNSTRSATQAAHHLLVFLDSALKASEFHAKGAVRLLVWMDEKDKQIMLPRVIYHRKRSSVMSELICRVEEVVGVPHQGLRTVRRETSIDLQSCMQALDRMKRNRIPIIPGRLEDLPLQVLEGLQKTNGGESTAVGETMEVQRCWHAELRELEDGFRTGRYMRHDGVAAGTEQRTKTSLPLTPEFLRRRQLKAFLKSQNQGEEEMAELLKFSDKLTAMHVTIATHGSLGAEERELLLQKLDRHIENFNRLVEDLTPPKIKSLQIMTDNRQAWKASILEWDRRMAEPLVPVATEFFAPKAGDTLALLDFQPDPSMMSKLTLNQIDILQAIIASIFKVPSLSIVEALDTMAPNVANALIPHAPSLRDPLKGGRRDVENLRVRVLTREMLVELALAWDDWPFQPSLAEMSCGLGNDGYGARRIAPSLG